VSGVPDEKLPRDFGKYRLVRKIATGGMAEIFLAQDRASPDAPIVVKRILPHLMENKEFVSMFLDEARIAAQLRHENIVEIFDVGRIEGAFYIAMEWVHGEDVRRIYNQAYKLQRSLPLSHSIRVIAEAAIGLGFAHRLPDLTGKPLGVVHRDVSPQNILVTYDGRVKIVDFGIAKAERKVIRTRAGVLKGKYSYMSPEQAMGDPIDHRTDIFALGIILYETTTGNRLFKRHNELATLQAIMKCQITPPGEVLEGYPVELEKIGLKALSKDLDERYQRAEDFADDLMHFLRTSGLYVERESIADFMQDLFAEELAALEAENVPLPPRGSPPARPKLTAAPAPDIAGAAGGSVSEEEIEDVLLQALSSQARDTLDDAAKAIQAAAEAKIGSPGFVSDADDLSASDGTVADGDVEDFLHKAPVVPQTTRADRMVSDFDDDTKAEAPDDLAPTVAAAPVYRAPGSDPRRLPTSVPPEKPERTADKIEYTERVRSVGRGRAQRPAQERDSQRPKPRERPPRVRPTIRPEPPRRGPSKAVLIGATAFLLGIIVLLVVAIDRLGGDDPIPPSVPDKVVAWPTPPEPVAAESDGTHGQVTIVTEPNAMVSSNDVVLGKANAEGVAGPFKLPAGRRLVRVAVSSIGFERVRSLNVRADQIHEVEIAARQGWLKLAVAPWAKVLVDGKDLGITPLPNVMLFEGSHHVVLENPQIKKRVDRVVRVEAGSVAELKVDLNDVGEPM